MPVKWRPKPPPDVQSQPNYPFILFFAALGAIVALIAAFGWRHDSKGWRVFTLFFAGAMFAQSAYEFSFAFVPVREWIRVDLLLTIPFAATSLTLLLGRTALRWFLRERPGRR